MVLTLLPAMAFADDDWFDMQDFGAWGDSWPNAVNVGWKFNEGFDVSTITAIEVGIKDASGNLIVKYTADTETVGVDEVYNPEGLNQIAWQLANGYMSNGGQSSAPFYQAYDGAILQEGAGADWTVSFGDAFNAWAPATAYVTVSTADGSQTKENTSFSGTVAPYIATVNGTAYYDLGEAIKAAIGTEYAVEIVNDIDLTGKTWTPVEYSGGALTINGNGKTIKGMGDSLLNKTGSGSHVLTINNLTFAGCIDNTPISSVNCCAVICPYADSMTALTFNNVTLSRCSITSTNYAGGFIGYAGGWNKEGDGPVLQHVVFNNCTVDRCAIHGGGSVGALIGHAAGNVNTNVTVTGTTVTSNEILCTGSSNNKAGSLFGTVGAAGGTDRGLYVDANVAYNVVESNGTRISTVYGRQGTSTGTLEITGGSYDAKPIADADAAWASVKEDFKLVENEGVYTVEKMLTAKIGETEYATLAKAVAAAQEGDTIEIVAAGTYTLPTKALTNVTVKASVEGVVFDASSCGYGAEYNGIANKYSDVTFENVTIKLNPAKDKYAGFNLNSCDQGGLITFKNCTIEGAQYTYTPMTYENCTFNTGAGYAFTCYGKGDLKLVNCTFNVGSNGRAICIYNNNPGDYESTLTVQDCTFNADEGTAKGAIIIKGQNNYGTVDLNGTITVNGFTATEADNLYTGISSVDGLLQIEAENPALVIIENGKELFPKQYTVSGATINYGKVDAQGTVLAGETATIVAPEANFGEELVATGAELKATVEGDLNIGDAQIVYYEKGSETALEGAPVEAGTYVAKLTVGGVTAELEFTVNLCYPDAPVLTASNVASTGKVKLSWTAVDGAVKYKLYRATSRDGKYSCICTTSATSITNVRNVEVGECYYYYVVAVGYGGGTSEKSNTVYRTVDCATPVVTATNVASTGKVKLTWGAVEGAAKYEIYRATSLNGTYTKIYTTTKTSMINTSTQAGKTYYYKVKAISADTSAANSALSQVASQIAKLARPVVTASTNSAGNVVLKWSAVDGAAKYTVYRATSANGTYTKLFTTSKVSVINSTVTAGNTYYYKVVAVYADNTLANSAPSAIVSAKAK